MEIDRDALKSALEKNDEKALQTLLHNGSPQDIWAALSYFDEAGLSLIEAAARMGYTAIFTIFLQKAREAIRLSHSNNLSDLSDLLGLSLLEAARAGYVDIVQIILSSSDCDLSYLINYTNEAGDTALLVAAAQQQTVVVQKLFEIMENAGIDIVAALSHFNDHSGNALGHGMLHGDTTILHKMLSKRNSLEEKLFFLVGEFSKNDGNITHVLKLFVEAHGKTSDMLKRLVEELVDEGIGLNNDHMQAAGFDFDIEAYKAEKGVPLSLVIANVVREKLGFMDVFSLICEYLNVSDHQLLIYSAKNGRVNTLQALLKGRVLSEEIYRERHGWCLVDYLAQNQRSENLTIMNDGMFAKSVTDVSTNHSSPLGPTPSPASSQYINKVRHFFSIFKSTQTQTQTQTSIEQKSDTKNTRQEKIKPVKN